MTSHSSSKHYVNILKAGGLISRILIGIKESCWPAFMGLRNVLMMNVMSHDFPIIIMILHSIRIAFRSWYGKERMARDVDAFSNLSERMEKQCQTKDNKCMAQAACHQYDKLR